MEILEVMSFFEYYQGAVLRSFAAACVWALNQGIALNILFFLSVFFCAIAYATIRAHRKLYGWADAMRDMKGAARDFSLALFGTTAVVMVILFFVFFIADAPTQTASLKKTAIDVQRKLDITMGALDEIKGQMGFHVTINNSPTGIAATPYGITLVLQTFRVRPSFKITIDFDQPPASSEWAFVSQIPSLCQNSSFEGRDRGSEVSGKRLVIYAKSPAFTPFMPIVVNAATADGPISVISVRFDDY